MIIKVNLKKGGVVYRSSEDKMVYDKKLRLTQIEYNFGDIDVPDYKERFMEIDTDKDLLFKK